MFEQHDAIDSQPGTGEAASLTEVANNGEGDCGGTCFCGKPCTKVAAHHGQHYCPTHGAY